MKTINEKQRMWILELLKEPQTRSELIRKYLKSKGTNKVRKSDTRRWYGIFKRDFLDFFDFIYTEELNTKERKERKKKGVTGQIPNELHITWELFAKELTETNPKTLVKELKEHHGSIFNKEVINKLQKTNISFSGIVNICLALAYWIKNPKNTISTEVSVVIDHVLEKNNCEYASFDLLLLIMGHTTNDKFRLDKISLNGIQEYLSYAGFGGFIYCDPLLRLDGIQMKGLLESTDKIIRFFS